REPRRDALQGLAVVTDLAELVLELGRFDDRLEPGQVVDEAPAERRQPGAVGMPHPATDVDLARLEVEVAAAGVDVLGVRPARRRVDAVAGPAEARREMRLIR